MPFWDIVAANHDTPRRDRGMGPPLVLTGLPGIAKTSRMRRLARLKRCGSETIIPALVQSTEFGGQPYLNERVTASGEVERELALAPAAWAKRAVQYRRCTIVLDEGNLTSQEVFAALLRAVLENMVGDFDLGTGVNWVLLQNPIEVAERLGGVELAAQFVNRFGILDAGLPPFADWTDYVMLEEDPDFELEDDGNPEDREKRILQKWPTFYRKAAAEVVTFLTAKRERWMAYPKAGPDEHKPWPSPRSWSEGAIRARASAALHGLSPEDSFLWQAAFVGQEVVRELNIFTRAQDLPDPEAWLQGEAKFQPNDARPDRTQSFLVSVGLVLATLPKNRRKSEFHRLVRFAAGLQGRRDTVVRCFSQFAKTISAQEIMGLPADLEDFFHDIGEVANAARGGL